MLLKGVIDCPDLPLNVSRSFSRTTVREQDFNAYNQEGCRQADFSV